MATTRTGARAFAWLLAAALGAFVLGLAVTPTGWADTPPDQPVADSFTAQGMLKLKADGALELSGSLADAAVEESAQYKGMILQAKRAMLEDGRIELGEFDFGSQQAGRLTVDGVSERGWTVVAHVYLDDATDPVASVTLPHQQGKAGWALPGARTADVLGKNITGAHRVSLALGITKDSDPTANKKTSVLLRSVEFAQASIPTIYFDLDESQGSIDAMNGSADHSRECYGNMTVQVPAGYGYEYTGATAADIEQATYPLEYIRGRGNSTWMADKKPYKVKLDKKADLFGMGANKHWVLLANRYDNSLLRNKATYWLGQELGLEFTPQCVFVDVVMNGEYYGSYYLCEQVRVGSSRVDIVDLEDEPDASEGTAVTGGYLLSMDGGYGENTSNRTFTTKEDHTFTIESPEFDGYFNEAQFNYIRDFVQMVEDTVNAKGFKLKGTSYSDVLDVPSAVDYYWTQGVSLNGDAYLSGSTYLYKDRDSADAVSKLHWGPLWDFDYVAWGDLEYDGYNVSGFDFGTAPWAERLLTNKKFAQAMYDRWPVLKAKLQELTASGGMLDTWASQLVVSRYYDVEKHGAYGEDVWGWFLVDGQDQNPEAESRTYAQEVDQLRGWINERIAWVDDNIASMEPVPCTVEFYVDGNLLTSMESLVGRPLGELPQAPAESGFTFVGWMYEDPEYGEFEASSDTAAIGSTMKLNAEYISNAEIVAPSKIYFQQSEAYYPLENGWFSMPYELTPFDAWSRMEWSSSNTSVATVDEYGSVELRAAGTVKITANCAGTKASYTLHVVDGDVYEAGYLAIPETAKVKKGAYYKVPVTLEPADAIMPTIEWMSLDPDVAEVGAAGVVMGVAPGTTYVIARMAGIDSSIAVCKVTVPGAAAKPSSSTSGGKAKPVNISKKAKVAKVKSRSYTGKKITPKLKVTYQGKKLKLKRDYTVKYGANKKIGIAKATITFKGSYKGKKTVKFKIVPKGTSVKKLVKAKKSFTVKWKKRAKQISGYRVQFSTNKKFVNNVTTKKVKGKAATSQKFSKLKAKKVYYVRVGTYKTVGGKTYYSSWSKVKKVKTK